ncbi:unnamed protein product, partial [Symbiodinium microadriaticum]
MADRAASPVSEHLLHVSLRSLAEDMLEADTTLHERIDMRCAKVQSLLAYVASLERRIAPPLIALFDMSGRVGNKKRRTDDGATPATEIGALSKRFRDNDCDGDVARSRHRGRRRAQAWGPPRFAAWPQRLCVVACEAGGRWSTESLRFVIIVSFCESVLSALLPPCACCPAKLAAPLLGRRFDKVHLLLRFWGPLCREFHTQLSPLDDALHDAGAAAGTPCDMAGWWGMCHRGLIKATLRHRLGDTMDSRNAGIVIEQRLVASPGASGVAKSAWRDVGEGDMHGLPERLFDKRWLRPANVA